MVHVGCSGTIYTDWRGLLYPSGCPSRRNVALVTGDGPHRPFQTTR